ncbi:MAG: DUF3810 domain-containing protein [Flavobacteriaceae bacterium]|nr:DUF3810 domain-containing protein [Flavobacteriaceae bacterium]NNL33223.1 DUF3810 domain-containing protein [Flavobacteriaceae bacterium]
MRSRTKTIIALSIIPQILVVKLLSRFPTFIENYYSNGLYLWVSKAMRFVFGWVPFSVGDVLYTIASIYVIRWFLLNRRRIIKDTKYWLRDILVAVSLLYFSFHILWGMNYYRLPLHESLGLDYNYSTEELAEVTDQLTLISNTLHAKISASDSMKITMPYEKVELLKTSPSGYDQVKATFPQLDPSPISLKRSIYSLPLTYMGFSGYLNPFTNEAQIDGLIPLHKYPSTSSHELAHQIGYAAENEANFVGFLAATKHENEYYQYSGYIFGLKYCLVEILRRDPELFEQKKAVINQGILNNYEEERLFWESYQNPLEPIFKSTFNTFLKANNQDKGIESYSYVVALLVNYLK